MSEPADASAPAGSLSAGGEGGARCGSCGARIIWATNTAGNRVPLDAEPVSETGAGLYALLWPDDGRSAPRAIHAPPMYLTHMATCPNAAKWRRRG